MTPQIVGIGFYGNVVGQAFGEPLRVELLSANSPTERAIALTVAMLKNRILHVNVTAGKGENTEGICDFIATLPLIQTCIVTQTDGVKIKLDVPQSDLEQMIRLAGHSDKVLRFFFTESGMKPEKPKREMKPKEPKGEHGHFWREFRRRNLESRTDICDWLGCNTPQACWERLHELFGGGSLSFIAPAEIIAQLREAGLESAVIACEEIVRDLNRPLQIGGIA